MIDTTAFETRLDRTQSSSLKWEKYGDEDILPMWVADMDFAVAEPILQALRDRMNHPVFGYTVVPDSLRESIASHLKREYDWHIDTDWLVFLPGVVAGMAVSCRAFCADDDQIMVNPPIYHHFYDSHEDKRQTLVKIPLMKTESNHRWTYDIDAMRNACSKPVSMLMMCTPHNPTGTVFEKAELKQVGDMCAANDMTIVSDEIHCDLVIDDQSKHVPTALACPEHADRIITLMSASKTWNLAGLNTSFAIISNEKKREQFVAASQSIVSPVPPLALTATQAAFDHGDPWRQAVLKYLYKNYEKIGAEMASIPGLSLEPLQATYLAWIDATDLGLENTQAHFEKYGIGLSSGEQFGQPNYLRLNFACPASLLDEGLSRMRSAANALNKA